MVRSTQQRAEVSWLFQELLHKFRYKRHQGCQKDRKLLTRNYWWLCKCQIPDQRFCVLSMIHNNLNFCFSDFQTHDRLSLSVLFVPTHATIFCWPCQDTKNPASQPVQWPRCKYLQKHSTIAKLLFFSQGIRSKKDCLKFLWPSSELGFSSRRLLSSQFLWPGWI